MTSTRPAAGAREKAVMLLRGMVRIRRFEEKAAELYSLGKIRGFLHLYIGEEAIAVGAMASLAPSDRIVSTYREHGHALARGVPMNEVMAEMYGKAAGCSRGRGGSMHLFDISRGFYGGYAIVGGGLPIATGLALADAMRHEPSVTACFFGDGAVLEGEFHEAMNLAALWKLPVLFLCENNRYAMGTAIERGQSQLDMKLRSRGYGVPAEVVDGMDVVAVETAVARAAAAVRRGRGPRLLELQTYRFRAHSMSDPDLYRDVDEVEQWKQRDPIETFIAAQGLDADEVAQVESAVADEIDASVAFAEMAPTEPVTQLERDVYTPVEPL